MTILYCIIAFVVGFALGLLVGLWLAGIFVRHRSKHAADKASTELQEAIREVDKIIEELDGIQNPNTQSND